MLNPIDLAFKKAKNENRPALLTYTVAGDSTKEISLKNLSKIINARTVEIIEQVYLEIKNYGHEEQKKKLIAGIVLTGGGSQLKHLKQLVEYVTGMDTRVGYPNEHLAGDTDKNVTSPLYSTAVGLVMDGLSKIEKNTTENLELENSNEDDGVIESNEEDNSNEKEQKPEKIKIKRESFLDKLTKNLQDFLDNAE